MVKKLNEVKNALKRTDVLVEVVQTQGMQIEDLYQRMDDLNKNFIKIL